MALDQTIETIAISKLEFQELAGDLINSMVSGVNSPFSDMMDRFQNYLETGSDLDPTQQAAKYAGLLQDAYADINKQAMNSALDLLKSNEQLVLERYQTEIAYNKGLKDLATQDEQKELTAKQVIGQDYNNKLALEKIAESKYNQAKIQAELKKQWGQTVTLGDATEVEVDDGNGTVTTTTTFGGTVIADTGLDNVIDKQIIGYDRVNQKDALKTMDERAALMQHAKIPETANEKVARLALIKEIIPNVTEIQNLPDLS